MEILLSFPRGTTLEERYRYIADRALYCQRKIVNYDSVINEFEDIKKNLESIVENSKQSIETCNFLKKKVFEHESSLKQSHQRTTEESQRSDCLINKLEQKIADLSEELMRMNRQHRSDLNTTEDSIRTDLDCYMTIEASYDAFKIHSDFVNNLQVRVGEAGEHIAMLYQDVAGLRESVRNNADSIEALRKDICRLQNSLVYNHSEVMKRINEVAR